MLYIITALKPEAQAFVDKYKLIKNKYKNFTLHRGKDIVVIVSGIGNKNAKIATDTIIEKFKPSESDIFLNVGICAASKEHQIGELLQIGSIIYDGETFILNKNISHAIICKDSEAYEYTNGIADMESFGFYEATKEMKNRFMYKVVSDNFEPHMVTKEKTKALIFNVIDEIMQRVKS